MIGNAMAKPKQMMNHIIFNTFMSLIVLDADG